LEGLEEQKRNLRWQEEKGPSAVKKSFPWERFQSEGMRRKAGSDRGLCWKGDSAQKHKQHYVSKLLLENALRRGTVGKDFSKIEKSLLGTERQPGGFRTMGRKS